MQIDPPHRHCRSGRDSADTGPGAAWAIDYPAPKPLQEGSQADTSTLKKTRQDRASPTCRRRRSSTTTWPSARASRPPPRDAGVETFMLAPQSGADINGQMGMIQDVITQDVERHHPVHP